MPTTNDTFIYPPTRNESISQQRNAKKNKHLHKHLKGNLSRGQSYEISIWKSIYKFTNIQWTINFKYMKYLTTICLDSHISNKGKYSRKWTVQSSQRNYFLEQKQEPKGNTQLKSKRFGLPITASKKWNLKFESLTETAILVKLAQFNSKFWILLKRG